MHGLPITFAVVTIRVMLALEIGAEFEPLRVPDVGYRDDPSSIRGLGAIRTLTLNPTRLNELLDFALIVGGGNSSKLAYLVDMSEGA